LRSIYLPTHSGTTPVGLYAEAPATQPGTPPASLAFYHFSATPARLSPEPSGTPERVQEQLPACRRGAAAADAPCIAASGLDFTGPIPLAPNDVKDCFTLFPKCFSSFVHTTCSLSDLVQYLAFGEVHLRITTAFSNCRTLGSRTHPCGNAVRDGRYGAVTLHGLTFQ